MEKPPPSHTCWNIQQTTDAQWAWKKLLFPTARNVSCLAELARVAKCQHIEHIFAKWNNTVCCWSRIFWKILEEIEPGISTKGGAKFIFGNAFWHCAWSTAARQRRLELRENSSTANMLRNMWKAADSTYILQVSKASAALSNMPNYGYNQCLVSRLWMPDLYLTRSLGKMHIPTADATVTHWYQLDNFVRNQNIWAKIFQIEDFSMEFQDLLFGQMRHVWPVCAIWKR